MMKKNSTKGYVLLGILFALVSIIAFAVPTAKTANYLSLYTLFRPYSQPILHLLLSLIV